MSYQTLEDAIQALEGTNETLVQNVQSLKANALASAAAASKLYEDEAAGLAAVSDGDYFSIPGGGNYLELRERVDANTSTLVASYPNMEALAIAMAAGSLYADTGAGLAATSDGEYFAVPGSTPALTLYLNDAGSATSIAEWASRAQVEQAIDDAAQVAIDRTNVTNLASQVNTDSQAAVAAKNAAETARDQAQEIADPQGVMEATFDLLIPDVERRQIEAATSGQMTILRTPNGVASYYFVLPKARWEDYSSAQFGTGVMEAFLVGGVEKSERMVGAFPAAMVNGEIVCRPGLEARNNRDWDQAKAECEALGTGYSMMTNWDWMAAWMWCMANGFEPRGNTDQGHSHSHPHERGVLTTNSHTLAGTGPNSWNHNNAANGIADLVGNYWEWLWGLKLQDGEVILAPDNDTTLAESGWVNQSVWFSGGGDNQLRGDVGDVVYDGTIGDDVNGGTSQDFTWSTLTTDAPNQALRRAGIEPNGLLDAEGNLWYRNYGERFPRRGGSRRNGADAGLGALYLTHSRSFALTYNGFRPAFAV